jgi:hypothetical protein
VFEGMHAVGRLELSSAMDRISSSSRPAIRHRNGINGINFASRFPIAARAHVDLRVIEASKASPAD